MVGASLLSGLYVPIHLFPGWLLTIAEASPFPAMLQLPIDVISGKFVGSEALEVLGVQLAWVCGLLILTRIMTHFGIRRLVIQGG